MCQFLYPSEPGVPSKESGGLGSGSDQEDLSPDSQNPFCCSSPEEPNLFPAASSQQAQWLGTPTHPLLAGPLPNSQARLVSGSMAASLALHTCRVPCQRNSSSCPNRGSKQCICSCTQQQPLLLPLQENAWLIWVAGPPTCLGALRRGHLGPAGGQAVGGLPLGILGVGLGGHSIHP